MKILMMTNTYFPIVGGIERSIQSFSEAFRKLGHEVKIVAPAFAGAPKKEEHVIRLPAIQKVRRTVFSVNYPVAGPLSKLLRTFVPDIVHSHHPFFIGDFALRVSREYKVPLVFTYHIMFEHYLHYWTVQSEASKRFIIELSTGYANLCQQVVAPSVGVRNLLLERGVTAPIEVVPTGIDVKGLAKGHGRAFRERYRIPADSLVIGYVGRLAPEKNIDYLVNCLIAFLRTEPKACALFVGEGPLKSPVKKALKKAGLGDRVIVTGLLRHEELADAYAAMDVFAFTSLSETQGVVLTEAMAAGVPVVAVEATGVRDVVKNYVNGRSVSENDQAQFIHALSWVLNLAPDRLRSLKEHARATAQRFSEETSVRKMLNIYERLCSGSSGSHDQDSAWQVLAGRLEADLDILENLVEAGGAAFAGGLYKKK